MATGKTSTLTFRIEPALKEALRTTAEREHRSILKRETEPPMISAYQAKYFAHDLTRRCPGSVEKLAGAVASAQVESCLDRNLGNSDHGKRSLP